MSDSNTTTPLAPEGSHANPGTPPAATKSALTLWALIVAIVAIVSAIIPGLSFIAWVPALVATILGIVGLATKRPGRGKAITAIILGPIALLVAIIVSIGTIAAGISDALPSTDSTSAGDAPADAEPDAAAVGTRANPAPAGSTVIVSDNSGEIYEIAFGAATLDANSIIAAENMFNQPADAGSQYILVPITFTYVGEETGTPWIDLQFAFVSAAGTTHDGTSSIAVAPQPITDINELYPDASASGNLVLMVPTADIEKGLLTVSPLFGDKYFVALV
ncbi:DUF4190 domain-containing protein [Brevundimonas sp.]|jgi:hypothetical protein|uniref:DUF4190 domain-containing protein n=1 Tax=Brevundimonas sp. TaxID=1871086 RepID=UPI003783063A